MSQLKAVVLKKEGTLVTVLLADGSFRKIRYNKQVEIGMEINVSASKEYSFVGKLHNSPWKRMVSIAAVFLLVFLGMTGWNMYEVSTAKALISIDAKSSIQLLINKQGEVQSVQPLNQEAKRLLSGISLKGLPWQEAVSNIMERSINTEYLIEDDSLVLVGYSSLNKQNSQVSEEETGITSEKLAEEVTNNVIKRGINTHILAYDLTYDEQTKAKQEGLSLGEYALLNTANKAGISVSSGDVKEISSRSKVIQEPVVKEQIKKDKELGVYSKEVKVNREQDNRKTQSKNQSKDEYKNNSNNTSPPQKGTSFRNNM